jgi:hypothetical protein
VRLPCRKEFWAFLTFWRGAGSLSPLWVHFDVKVAFDFAAGGFDKFVYFYLETMGRDFLEV